MKSKYLPILCFCISVLMLSAISARAGIDTLTLRQVYAPLSVGDTFDFQYYEDNQFIGHIFNSFGRKILTQKLYSNNGDTLFLTYDQLKDTIVNLDSSAISSLSAPNNLMCSPFLTFDTMNYGGLVSNAIYFQCNSVGVGRQFTKGLGVTRYEDNRYDNFSSLSDRNTKTLVYYSNGIIKVGTPYNILLGNTDISIKTVSAFPNPFQSAISIEAPIGNPESIEIKLYNILGVEVLSKRVDGISSTDHINLDTDSLPPGLYLLYILSGKMTMLKRMIK